MTTSVTIEQQCCLIYIHSPVWHFTLVWGKSQTTYTQPTRLWSDMTVLYIPGLCFIPLMQTKKKTYALLLFYFLGDETIVVLHFKIYLFLSFLYPRTLYLLSCSLPSLMHLYEDHDDQSLIMIILTTIIIIIKISRSSEILSLWCFIMQMQHCRLKHKEHFLFIWSLKNWTLSQAQLSQTVDWWLHTKPAVPTVAQKAGGQTGMLNKHSQSVVSSFYMVLVQCKKKYSKQPSFCLISSSFEGLIPVDCHCNSIVKKFIWKSSFFVD